MVLAAELEPQRHRHAGKIPAAKDRVAARQRDQRGDRVGLLVDQSADLAPPGLIDPLDDRSGKVLLVVEVVIYGAARVAGLARHLLEHEVAIAVPGQASRGRLQQRAAGAGAPLGLGLAGALPRRAGARAGEHARWSFLCMGTYMHVCMITSASTVDDGGPR